MKARQSSERTSQWVEMNKAMFNLLNRIFWNVCLTWVQLQLTLCQLRLESLFHYYWHNSILFLFTNRKFGMWFSLFADCAFCVLQMQYLVGQNMNSSRGKPAAKESRYSATWAWSHEEKSTAVHATLMDHTSWERSRRVRRLKARLGCVRSYLGHGQ